MIGERVRLALELRMHFPDVAPLPLGAIIARADIMDWGPGSHASTFGGNPVSCVAALETVKLLEEELMANARSIILQVQRGNRNQLIWMRP